MRRSLHLCLSVLAFCDLLQGQSSSQPIEDCKPQMVIPAHKSPQSETGVSYKGYKRSPVVAFEVDEAGVVRNARIERRSGSKAADELALRWIQSLQYKPRPGCGTLSSKASVTIDFTAP